MSKSKLDGKSLNTIADDEKKKTDIQFDEFGQFVVPDFDFDDALDYVAGGINGSCNTNCPCQPH